jgi:hypothetical protein
MHLIADYMLLLTRFTILTNSGYFGGRSVKIKLKAISWGLMKIVTVVAFLALCSPLAHASRQFQSNTDTLLAGSAQLPPSGTFTFMVNPQFTLGDGNNHFLFDIQNATKNFIICAGPSQRIFAEWVNGSAGTFAIGNSPTFPVNTWSAITVTWVSGGTLSVYLNGNSIASAGGANWFDTTGMTWSFGNAFPAPSPDIRSKLARIGLWSRVLTAPEIAAMANITSLPSDLPLNLIAEYDLTGSSLAAQAGTGGPLVASGPVAASDPPVRPPPSLSMTGPATATKGVPVYLTAGETFLSKATVVTPSDGGAGGSFLPSTATLTAGNASATFAYTPATTGSIAISLANNQGIPNPASLTLQSVAVQPMPSLSVDAPAKSAARGTDVSYSITQAIPNGYTGDAPALRVFNAPAGFAFSVNGVDCGGGKQAISYFNWSNCGHSASGTYRLTVHTAALSPGVYYFSVTESERQASNGSGLTLTLTVN